MQTFDDPVLSATGAHDAEHLVCECSPHIAACGATCDPADFKPDATWDGSECILCVAGADEPCPRCGE